MGEGGANTVEHQHGSDIGKRTPGRTHKEVSLSLSSNDSHVSINLLFIEFIHYFLAPWGSQRHLDIDK